MIFSNLFFSTSLAFSFYEGVSVGIIGIECCFRALSTLTVLLSAQRRITSIKQQTVISKDLGCLLTWTKDRWNAIVHLIAFVEIKQLVSMILVPCPNFDSQSACDRLELVVRSGGIIRIVWVLLLDHLGSREIVIFVRLLMRLSIRSSFSAAPIRWTSVIHFIQNFVIHCTHF